MSIENFKTKAEKIRSTNVYDIYDYAHLKNMTLSLTELHSQEHTSGHSHNNADEVYVCLMGRGLIELDDIKSKFEEGDIVIIPRGKFHKVYNDGRRDLIFFCIFDKYGERK